MLEVPPEKFFLLDLLIARLEGIGNAVRILQEDDTPGAPEEVHRLKHVAGELLSLLMASNDVPTQAREKLELALRSCGGDVFDSYDDDWRQDVLDEICTSDGKT